MRYEPIPMGRTFMRVVFAFLGVGGLLLVAAMLLGGFGENGPPPIFPVAWLGALGWNANWWLFRIATSLEIDHGVLRSETPLRRGETLVTDILEVRPVRLVPNGIVIEVRDRRPILTIGTKGFRSFCDELVLQRPDLPVRVGWQTRLQERMPGRNRSTRN